MKSDLDYYNKAYSESEEYAKEPEDSFYFPMWQKIKNLLSDTERIYEIGCGSGQLAKLIKNKNYIKGIDYSSVAIDMAKRNNRDVAKRFKVKDIYKITVEDFSDIDTVLCAEVLEHLDDDMFLINIIPSGMRIIFSVPNFMYQTHKRVYPNLDYIKNRYQKLNIKTCDTIQLKNPKSKIYLIDSTKI